MIYSLCSHFDQSEDLLRNISQGFCQLMVWWATTVLGVPDRNSRSYFWWENEKRSLWSPLLAWFKSYLITKVLVLPFGWLVLGGKVIFFIGSRSGRWISSKRDPFSVRSFVLNPSAIGGIVYWLNKTWLLWGTFSLGCLKRVQLHSCHGDEERAWQFTWHLKEFLKFSLLLCQRVKEFLPS